jgi:hypothetical protein
MPRARRHPELGLLEGLLLRRPEASLRARAADAERCSRRRLAQLRAAERRLDDILSRIDAEAPKVPWSALNVAARRRDPGRGAP